MAANRTSFEKLQRDRAKKAKAALKREKRLEKGEEGPEGTDETTTTPEWLNLPPGQAPSAGDLLEMVATLHRQFENEEISFDEFEERKTELFASLSVD